MQPSTVQLELRAERAVRRGELLVALELYEAVLAQRPDEERVRQRMEAVRALLHPSELVNRRRADPDESEARPAAEPLSDAEQGEVHAAAGRFVEATLSYRRAVEKNPKNELLRERLEELRALAPPGARADLAAAERLEAATPQRGAPRLDRPRSAKVADAAFGPMDAGALPARETKQGSLTRRSQPPRSLPEDPIQRLQALLARIRGGRRRTAAGT